MAVAVKETGGDVKPLTNVGWGIDTDWNTPEAVPAAGATAISVQGMVSPAALVKLPVVAPSLPNTRTVTAPAPRSPLVGVAVIGPPPRLAGVTTKSIKLRFVPFSAFTNGVPVPTCRNKIRGIVTRKSKRALAVPFAGVGVLMSDSACDSVGNRKAAQTATEIRLSFIF